MTDVVQSSGRKSHALSRRTVVFGGVATLGVASLDCSSLGRVAFAQGCPAERNEIFFDSQGLVVQQSCDGGDTAQREGMYWLGQWVRTEKLEEPWYGARRERTFEEVMAQLEHEKTGRFVRHPGQEHWNEPDRTSRDQVLPLVAAMGVNKDYERFDRFTDQLRRDGYKVNCDTLLPWIPFIDRARRRPVQRFIDEPRLNLAVNTVIEKARDDMDDVGDDLNLIVDLLLAAVLSGDQWVAAIRRRYVEERPSNYGAYLGSYRKAYGTKWNGTGDANKYKQMMVDRIKEGIEKGGWKPDTTNVKGALRWYFRAESGGSPGMAALYEPILEKFFWTKV